MSGPFVRKIQHRVMVSPVTSDGGWWPRSPQLAADPPLSTEPLSVRSNWVRAVARHPR